MRGSLFGILFKDHNENLGGYTTDWGIGSVIAGDFRFEAAPFFSCFRKLVFEPCYLRIDLVQRLFLSTAIFPDNIAIALDTRELT